MFKNLNANFQLKRLPQIYIGQINTKKHLFIPKKSKLCLERSFSLQKKKKFMFFLKKEIAYLHFFFSFKKNFFTVFCSLVFNDRFLKTSFKPIKFNRFLCATASVFLSKFSTSYTQYGYTSNLLDINDMLTALVEMSKNAIVHYLFIFIAGKYVLRQNLFSLLKYNSIVDKPIILNIYICLYLRHSLY
jgi:hypothetical protein